MRILGIDPGLAEVGWGFIIFPEGGPGDVRWGRVRTDASDSMALRLQDIYHSLRDLIADVRPDAIAVEQLYFQTNVKTAIVVAQARGVAILATAESGVPVAEYTPLQIKKAVTGRGRASKSQVQRMVAALLGLETVPEPDHAADALAAALCHGHTLKTSRIAGIARRR